MGFEHQIYFEISTETKAGIHKLLTEHPLFSGIVVLGENEFFEFRNVNENNMPDFSITIQDMGLYVVHNIQPKPWADIDFVRQYLIEQKINHTIEEL